MQVHRESVDLVGRGKQVRRRWNDEHCPHIHGAGRTAVIDKDHRAVRRAVLSTRKCVATPIWARGAVDLWSMRRKEKFGRMRMVGVPLDVGVGRGVRDLRNACIPQTNVILARAGFSLGGDEWESGARGVSLARGRIAGQRDGSGAPQRGRTGRNSRDPHIHGAGRPAVIGLDHRAGRRAVLSTR